MGSTAAGLAREVGGYRWIWVLNEYLQFEDGRFFDTRFDDDHPTLVEPIRHAGGRMVHARTTCPQADGESVHHLPHDDGCRLDRPGEVLLAKFRPLTQTDQQTTWSTCPEPADEWLETFRKSWDLAREEEKRQELDEKMRRAFGGQG